MNEFECVVCNYNKINKHQLFYSKSLPRYFHWTGICPNCGHIQVYPLFSDEMIAKINDRYHSGKFLTSPTNKNNIKKLATITEALEPFINNKKSVLDIGAGEAWSKAFFDQHQVKYYAIEPVKKLAQNIENISGTVIGKDIFDNLENYNEKFDVIILRHVIEHTRFPEEMLRKIHNLLSKEGIFYLALPNAGIDDIKKPLRTSFYRPSHISYFHEGNVQRLFKKVGFKDIAKKHTQEITFVLQKSEPEIVNENYYKTQFNRSKSLSKAHLFNDVKFLFKQVIKAMLFRK